MIQILLTALIDPGSFLPKVQDLNMNASINATKYSIKFVEHVEYIEIPGYIIVLNVAYVS